jgi:hypothetical protein
MQLSTFPFLLLPFRRIMARLFFMGGTNAQLPIDRPVSLPGFTEFTEIDQIETDWIAKVESEFNKMITQATI